MAKRKRETKWEVIRIKATPAAFVGTVHAPEKAIALKTAIKQFNIRREDQSRLLIRPK
jgi:1,2-phenylacetyl-CoA epoxidase PaaB subunit